MSKNWRYGKAKFLRYGLGGIMKRFPKKQLFLHDMRKDWKAIVGKNTAAHSFPDDIRNETLIINVDDPIWIQELSLIKDEIKQHVVEHFRKDPYVKVVQSIKFQNGPLQIEEAKKSAKKELTIDRETIVQIDQTVAKIEDPELRKAMRHYLIECNYHSVDKETEE